jgi:hypothetical protein
VQVPFAVQFLFIFMTRRLLQGVLRLGGPLGPYWSNLKPNVDKSDICHGALSISGKLKK